MCTEGEKAACTEARWWERDGRLLCDDRSRYRILLPQTKTSLRLSAVGRAKKDSSPRGYRRNVTV